MGKRYVGVFPLLREVETIGGRVAIRGHRHSMLLVENRYREAANGGCAIFVAKAIARGRLARDRDAFGGLQAAGGVLVVQRQIIA